MPKGIYQHKPHSEETKRKIRKRNLGQKRSEKTKRKVSEATTMSYIRNPDLLRIRSEMSRGEKNSNWQNNKCKKLYTSEWTKTLRRTIRERDKYICQLCSKIQKNRFPSVHHIDYDKANCNPTNLITLCNSCNVKMNYNRKSWQKYFEKKMKNCY